MIPACKYIFTDYHSPDGIPALRANPYHQPQLALAPVIAGAALIYAALRNDPPCHSGVGLTRRLPGCLEDVWSIPILISSCRPTTAACSILPSLRISGRRARRRGTGFQAAQLASGCRTILNRAGVVAFDRRSHDVRFLSGAAAQDPT